MLHLLRRHPWAVEAKLEWSLAMVFAIPEAEAQGLISPGMEVDGLRGVGFIAAAFVRTRNQKPTWMPGFMKEDFHLAGWRVFVKVRTPDGKQIRGLKVLQSDTDSRRLSVWGNVLTRYGFRHVKVKAEHDAQAKHLHFESRSSAGEVEVDFDADLNEGAELPTGSPFIDLKEARRFAGPTPYTFSHEPETNSIIMVRGSKQHWQPKPIAVNIRKMWLFQKPPFISPGNGEMPRLANAFYVENVDYLWQKGVRFQLSEKSEVKSEKGFSSGEEVTV